MEKVKLICIGCPLGCPMEVEMENGQLGAVSGNTCKNGEKYARKELTNPTRIVSSTVRVKGGRLAVVSVKTEVDIPKDKIFACVQALKEIEILAPVKIGDVVLANVADTGVNVIATKEVLAEDTE